MILKQLQRPAGWSQPGWCPGLEATRCTVLGSKAVLQRPLPERRPHTPHERARARAMADTMGLRRTSPWVPPPPQSEALGQRSTHLPDAARTSGPRRDCLRAAKGHAHRRRAQAVPPHWRTDSKDWHRDYGEHVCSAARVGRHSCSAQPWSCTFTGTASKRPSNARGGARLSPGAPAPSSECGKAFSCHSSLNMHHCSLLSTHRTVCTHLTCHLRIHTCTHAQRGQAIRVQGVQQGLPQPCPPAKGAWCGWGAALLPHSAPAHSALCLTASRR